MRGRCRKRWSGSGAQSERSRRRNGAERGLNRPLTARSGLIFRRLYNYSPHLLCAGKLEKENSDFKPGVLGRSKGSSGYPPGSWPPNLPTFAQRATGDTSAVSFL